ncbi:hypothetical protein [Aureivirga marina]|uniref:hypothetical protein n=1 Tax=Aureivirga marina TaxID=1182451 RepID=UPI0018C90E6E|nr:hypothetical protein [Aureivirga marina]
MKLLGLDDVVELRLVNFIFVLWGVNGAVRKNVHINKEYDYFQNISISLSTASLAVILSTVSLAIYLQFISPSFIKVLETSFVWGNNLTAPMAVFAVFFEGMGSAVITSFIIMQYWKDVKKTIVRKKKAK